MDIEQLFQTAYDAVSLDLAYDLKSELLNSFGTTRKNFYIINDAISKLLESYQKTLFTSSNNEDVRAVHALLSDKCYKGIIDGIKLLKNSNFKHNTPELVDAIKLYFDACLELAKRFAQPNNTAYELEQKLDEIKTHL